jgi:hypothetical protein
MAATPAHRGCAGESFSAFATEGREWGATVADFATNTGGVGDEVQALLAGELSDEDGENTCND